MRIATVKDKSVVVDILTEAFDDNKSVNYVILQDNHRVERIRKLMTYSFDVCLSFGKVYIDDANTSCALILFPDRKKSSLKTILWDVDLAVNAIGVSRVFKVLKRESKITKSHPKEPICYLWFIGVKKEAQGKGLGSKMMHEIVNECEKEKKPIYLETSVERNLSLYERFGFQIFNKVHLDYTLYLLRRPFR